MKNIFLFIALQFPFLLFSQKNDNLIDWNEHKKLTWEDFKGSSQKIGDVAALTATHLGFSYNIVNGKITYSIECRFEKNKSWGRVKTSWILNHEQGHFDIAEIFSRKLFKAVSAYQFNKSTFQNDLDIIYKKVVEEKDLYQQLYDLETDHSRNKTKQEEWLKKINDNLNELKAWAGYN
jgi:hypothetical protein